MMNIIPGSRRPQDHRHLRAWGLPALISLLAIVLNACASSSTTPSSNANNANSTTQNVPALPPDSPRPAKSSAAVPKSLVDAGEYGENIYDHAKANDWKNATAKLAGLKDAIKKARTEVRYQDSSLDRLEATVSAIDRAVSATDRQATIREANQVTLNVAEMTTAYKVTVPVEVVKLDYYGRELEIWAEAKDLNKLQATTREMRKTWDALRPTIESRKAAEAKKFEALIAQLESAKAPADYAKVAKPVLDEVDNLEKLFP